ncbi:MAG: rhodanese-like domain-containing protein [Verrucomicrobiota bacterium]
MRSLLKEFVFIAALVGAGAGYSLISGLAPPPWAEPELAPGEIRYDDVAPLEVIWIDSRESEAYEAEHLDDAIHLNEDNWDGALPQLMERWLPDPRPIVVYCASEACGTSRRVADRLRDALPDAEIYSLKGGWPQ